MRYLILVALLVVGAAAHAATRDFPIQFQANCATVEGDSLDADGDGICEQLGGYRVYDARTGLVVSDFAEDGTRDVTLRFNADWGDQCFWMTAYMTDPVSGSELESAPSNTGACKTVQPGKPNAPTVTN